MMATPSLVRVTPDHLALIRALITAGQTTRALELLDSVWHPTSPEEQCWYLRLWVLVEEGRVIEALELARGAVRELPGSAATSYLLAALEQAHGSPALARQALERAQLLAGEQWTPQLAALLDGTDPLELRAGTTEPRRDPVPDVRDGTTGISTLALATQLGAGLLFPLGSRRALLPVPDPRTLRPDPADAAPKVAPALYRRFGLIAAATVLASLWAIKDPIPAFLALAAMVVFMIRVPQRS